MFDTASLGVGFQDFVLVIARKLVLVPGPLELCRGIYKQDRVVLLRLFSTMMQVPMVVPKNRSGGS